MIGIAPAIIGFLMMLGLIFFGLHVAVAMFAVGLLGAAVYLGMPIIDAVGTQFWSTTNNFVLLAVPMFVLMGELLLNSGSTDRMYRSLSDWLSPLPGSLLHTNIAASGMFAAVSGSSVATAATISTVALPAFQARQYDVRLVLGSICAGATLGIMIPPSINLIIYGAMTNTSVGRLYMAGVVPGLLLVLLFMAVVVVFCLIRPSLAGERVAGARWLDRWRRLSDLLPPLAIFVVVMGSIYAGWATPTESAALGVLMALLLAAVNRTLSVRLLHECFLATVNLTAMIMLIVAAAFYLNFVIGILGIPQALAQFVGEVGATPIQLMLFLFLFYLLLGFFLETISMMVGTIPVIFPLVLALGIDPVWFGIFLVLMCEIALITPPVGMNLYVVQGVRREGSIMDVIYGTIPFLMMMFVVVALLIYSPDLALWLPRVTFG